MRCRWKFTHSGIMSDFAWNWFRAGHREGTVHPCDHRCHQRASGPCIPIACGGICMPHNNFLRSSVHWGVHCAQSESIRPSATHHMNWHLHAAGSERSADDVLLAAVDEEIPHLGGGQLGKTGWAPRPRGCP